MVLATSADTSSNVLNDATISDTLPSNDTMAGQSEANVLKDTTDFGNAVSDSDVGNEQLTPEANDTNGLNNAIENIADESNDATSIVRPAAASNNQDIATADGSNDATTSFDALGPASNVPNDTSNTGDSDDTIASIIVNNVIEESLTGSNVAGNGIGEGAPSQNLNLASSLASTDNENSNDKINGTVIFKRKYSIHLFNYSNNVWFRFVLFSKSQIIMKVFKELERLHQLMQQKNPYHFIHAAAVLRLFSKYKFRIKFSKNVLKYLFKKN